MNFKDFLSYSEACGFVICCLPCVVLCHLSLACQPSNIAILSLNLTDGKVKCCYLLFTVEEAKSLNDVSKAIGVETDWTPAEQAPTSGLFTHGGLFRNSLPQNICITHSLASFRPLSNNTSIPVSLLK